MKNTTCKRFELKKAGGRTGFFLLIASCLVMLAGCHSLQGAKSEEAAAYEKNFEIVGSEKDELIGQVNPAIFTTVDRDNKGAETAGRDVPQEGVELKLHSGRYHIGGNPAGNIFIYDENGDLIIKETVGDIGGVSSLTVDIEDTYSIVADGGYNEVVFTPTPTEMVTDLTAGIWEVGLDIKAGEYTIDSEYGFGYVEIFEKGKDPVLYEVIGDELTSSKSHIELTDGQKIRITQTSLVHFELVDESS